MAEMQLPIFAVVKVDPNKIRITIRVDGDIIKLNNRDRLRRSLLQPG